VGKLIDLQYVIDFNPKKEIPRDPFSYLVSYYFWNGQTWWFFLASGIVL
jgi:hypothetical protein